MAATDIKSELDKIIAGFKNEIASLRTNRATPALVENLKVNYYGVETELKALATISSPEARQLVIKPWDKNSLPAIEKTIINSNLGLAPIADKNSIRVAIPQLTEERRLELTKLLRKETETARIRVRQVREATLREIDRREKSGEINEDERFREREAVQKQIDEANHQIEKIGEAKEKEILSI